MAGRWADTKPSEAADWLGAASVQWWFAGGWAIDLWIGRQTRSHSDLEVGCFRRDLPVLMETFAGWDIQIARKKELTPYDPGTLPDFPFSLWLRRRDDTLWKVEVLAEERAGDRWHYRRDNRVSRPVSEAFVTVADQLVIAPEIQLLYKAAHLRPKDEADFTTALPLLSPGARRWLSDALAVAHPDHAWIGRLGALRS